MDREMLRQMGRDWARPSRWLLKTLGMIAAIPGLMILVMVGAAVTAAPLDRAELLPAVWMVAAATALMAVFPVVFWLAEQRGKREMAACFAALSDDDRERFRWEAGQFAANGGFYCGGLGLWVRHSTRRHRLLSPFRQVRILPYSTIVWVYPEFVPGDIPIPPEGPDTPVQGAEAVFTGGVVFYTADGCKHKYRDSRQSLPPAQLVENLRFHVPHAVIGYTKDRDQLARQDFPLFLRRECPGYCDNSQLS